MDRQEQERLVQDTKILGKINAAHRGAFREKFPAQVEHVLRLIAERLQLGLNKNTDLALDNSEVADLSLSLYNIYQVYKEVNDVQSISTPSSR